VYVFYTHIGVIGKKGKKKISVAQKGLRLQNALRRIGFIESNIVAMWQSIAGYFQIYG
jgi:hypothetical protein